MVYLGPSRGCETCKRRRKKSKRTCAGYQEQASQTLIFQRNYIHTTTRTDYWATLEPLARKCSLPVRQPYPGTDTLPDDAVPKEVSEDDVVEYAVPAFFYDFSISSQYSTSISTSVGYLKDLELHVQQKGLDSNLAKACMMISCANNARKLYRPSFITRAEMLYHELLLHLAKEVARPGSMGEKSDLIKLAWLMGLYENSTLSFVRGVFPFYSLGPRAQMRDPGLLHFQRSVNNLGLLHDILLEICPLRMEAERVLEESPLVESHLRALQQRADILSNRLAQWEDSVAPEAKPTIISHVQASSDPNIEVGRWPGPLHMHTDLRAVALLNISRVARCYLLDIIFWLKHMQADTGSDDKERAKAVQLIQDFTSSIPYHLVEDLHSFSVNVHRGNPIEQPGRAVGGLLLMYPLYIAAQLSIVPVELQDYFKRCLVWIGQNMGVGYASLLAKVRF
ncbi:putative C6 transcription factor [Aspergillus novofumigatus IBT 16806]|uniref:C6 finger domain protein n=1 Tax=Aspergillus novofumigatus (strain IBT 16806) TaxID=1392255 RepID=A0A2I1BUD4_ASPN1|nr:uncharacterized protein P174DRAFT_379449 [Aspergillus novofumigatus IBT 16806]PKX88976.1 hypothetical protein P174DRAFT_379449 [Aspergillus novofumigatus IBT 16806]